MGLVMASSMFMQSVPLDVYMPGYSGRTQVVPCGFICSAESARPKLVKPEGGWRKMGLWTDGLTDHSRSKNVQSLDQFWGKNLVVPRSRQE